MSIADKLTTVAENVSKVYAAGQNNKNREWWDTLTKANTLADYYSRFKGFDFSHVGGFNPPYTIRPTSAYQMLIDARGIEKITAAEIDFSLCTDFRFALAQCDVKEIELIDTRGAAAVQALLSESGSLVTVGKVILKADGSQTFNNSAFYSAYGLTNITFEGVIGSDIWFTYCGKLTHESLMSIINALKDFSGTATTKTLTIGSANLAKLSNSEKAIATEKGWTLA